MRVRNFNTTSRHVMHTAYEAEIASACGLVKVDIRKRQLNISGC